MDTDDLTIPEETKDTITETNDTKPIKRKSEALSLQVRVEVIRESSNGLSQRALALKFNCSKTQIQNIIKDKDRILREWQEGGNQFAKRKSRQRHENVNNFVWEWFKEARAKGQPLNGPILQEKAREFAAFFNVEKFNASNGWLDCFKKRHNIVFREIVGEGESEESDWRQRVANICESYNPQDVYNMDETVLYFRSVPDKSVKFQSKDQIQKCITLAFCINAVGEKEPPIVMHSRCDALQPGVDWYVNGHSWLTPDIFSQWVSKFNNKMIKEDRKILLLLDDAPCHPLLELSNVKFVFLPSRLQPLGQGIIQTFKMLYRRRMLRSLVARMNSSLSIYQLAKQITLSDAITWVKSAWSEVKPAISQHQFLLCGVKMEHINVTIEDDIATELDNIAIELSSLGEAAGIDVDLEPEENHVVPYYEANGDWEQQLLGSTWDEVSSGFVDLPKTEQASVTPMPLDQALNSIAALKALANSLGDCSKLKKALDVAEEELENIIVAQKLE